MASKPPKSILKPASAPGTLGADKAAADKAREVATTRANIIHHRRELEDEIHDSLVTLSKYPLTRQTPTTTYSAPHPAPSDADAFRAGVRLFQPSDYDDLIEERNANGLCGYTLCGEPRMKVRGEWKIVGSQILPREEVERWCSQACARRAMYIKVQLNETAAWERAGIESIQIDLYDEPDKMPKIDARHSLGKDAKALELDTQRKIMSDAKELAMERGDTGNKQNQRSIPIRVKEKVVTRVAEEPSLGVNDSHLVLDGYKTKFDAKMPGLAKVEAQNTANGD